MPVAPASPSPDDAPQMPLATRASVPSPDGKSATEERLRQDHPDTPPAKGAATAPAAEADGHGTAPSSGISAAAPSPEAASRGQPSDIAPTAAPAEADPMQPPALDDRLAEARNPGQRAEAIAPRELPRQLTAPVVELIQQGRDGKLDVSLNPEELGRVRLSASTGEGGVNLLLTAERPETLDLLRRHIAALQQELAGLGLEDVTFSFAGQGGRDVGGERAFQQQAATIESGDGDAVTAERPDGRTAGRGPAGTAPGGLDLRL